MKKSNIQRKSILSILIFLLITIFSVSELILNQNMMPVYFFGTLFLTGWIIEYVDMKKTNKG